MKPRIGWLFILVVLLAALITGCNWFMRSETKPLPRAVSPSVRLLRLFPAKTGTKWHYEGWVEYAHEMSLKSISKKKQQVVYQIPGKVWDASGGESKRDFNFSLQYIFTKNAVYEKIIKSDTPFPHQFKELKMLVLPLKKGTKWSQNVIINGVKRRLRAEILEVRTDSQKKRQKIKVRYRVPLKGMPNGIYEEIRGFTSGLGLTEFEKTFGESPEGRFNYRLFRLEVPGQGRVQYQ